MAVLSKLPLGSTCLDLIHPWNEHCFKTFIIMYKIGFKESVKIYSLLYVFSAVIFKRQSINVKHVIRNITRSSLFLSLNGSLFIGFICLIRRLLTFNNWTIAFIPAFMASIFSINIESQSRHQQLAVYMANNAIQTLYMMLKERGFVRDIKYGEIYVFCVATSIMMFLFVNNGVPSYLNNLLKLIVGDSELLHTDHNCNVQNKKNANEFKSIFSKYQSLLDSVFATFPQFKSKTCHHYLGCLSYSIKGFIKPFFIGTFIQYILIFMRNFKKIIDLKGILRKLIVPKNLQFGLFLGSFSMLFRTFQCLQRHIFKSIKGYNVMLSGFLAGISKLLYSSTYLSMYIFSKSFEVTCQHYFQNVLWIKSIKYQIIVMIYSIATAVVFHAALREPQNIPLSYYKFSERMTGGKISAIQKKE